MAHPYAAHRADKVEHQRVQHIAKGFARGGAVKHDDAKEDRKLIDKVLAERDAVAVSGRPGKQRADQRARGGRIHREDGGRIRVGSRVVGGSGSDRDTGVVHSIAGKTANVAWDSGVKTPTPIDILSPAGRARGGRTNKKGTHVNVIVAPQGGQAGPPIPPGLAGLGGPPPMPPRPPMAGPPPGGMPPPGMPPRQAGGRAYKDGGAVGGVTPTQKGTKVFRGSLSAKTPIQHTNNKSDGADIGRKKPITYKTGGRIESSKGPAKAKAPHLPGGSGGGQARLRKAKLATSGAY